MKKIFVSFLILLVASNSNSQNINSSDLSSKKLPDSVSSIPLSDNTDNQIFTRVEKEAEFPGGLAGWSTYLQGHLKANVPVKNNAPAGTYTVIIKFIVRKDGTINDVEADTNQGFGMEEEVMRVIKKGPKWIPGVQNGVTVNSYRRQPVTFVVENQ